MSIKKDLASGKDAEKYVVDLLCKIGINSHLNTDRKTQKFFDIYSDNLNPLLFEVKYDLYTEKSGNIAIEIWNTRKNEPSGLYITKSHFWVQVLPNPMRAYICKVADLKRFLKIETGYRIIDNAGDGNAKICLFPKDYIFGKVSFCELESFTQEGFLDYASGIECNSSIGV